MQPIFICFTENLNYALGWMVIHSLWQATIIAIVAAIVSIIGRKKSPQLRYWIYNTALLSVLITAIVTFCVYFDFTKEMGQTIFVPENFAAATEDVEKAGIVQTVMGTQATNTPLSIEGLRMYFNNHIYLIVTIWVLGVALFILKLLGGISYVYYLRSKLNFPADEYWLEMVESLGKKAGVKRTMELVESALVRSPLVVGHLKPMILFPIGAINKLNPQEVEAILAHEIAHVLRNDYVFNIIQSVIEALFYFHPAVWWISANIRAERENCCDDVAIVLCGNSMTYAKALVSLQEMAYYASPQIAMAFAGKQKNQLLFRVQRILKQPQNKTNVMEKLIATCLLLVMMVALSFGGNRLNNNNLADIKALENTSSPSAGVETNNTVLSNLPNSAKADLSKKHYLKFKNAGVLDSFPVGKDVADGNYNYADNMFQAKLTVKENAVVKLNINGSEIPPAEIKNHAGFINKITMRSSAPPQYDADNQVITATPEPPVPPATPVYSYSTTTPMPIFSESNGDMVVTNTDGSKTTISHRLEGGNKVQVVTTTQKDGSRSVTRSDKNGTVSETFDKKGKKITSNTVGRFPEMKVNTSTNTNISTNISSNDDSDEEDLYAKYEDIKEEIMDLRQEIKECDCTTNKDFRKKLINRLEALNATLHKGNSMREMEKIESEYDLIHQTWENGECEDNNSDNNGNIGYYNNNSTGNGASVSRNSATNRTNANRNSRKNDADLMQVFFLYLVNKGYAPVNRHVNLAFNNTGLVIESKAINQSAFNDIKNHFESYLSKPTRYSISFSGKLSNVTATGLNISGSLTSSIDDK